MDLRTALAAALLPTAPIAAQPVPLFHWTLNETNGSVAHDVYNNASGILQGGATWAPTAGYHGGACRFDGVDDRIILGPCDMTTGTGQFSLSAWVRPDFVTAMDRTILAKTVGASAQDHIWSMTFVNASALRFRLRTGPTTTQLSTAPSSIFSGVWYHVVGSFDGSTMRIYLNGALMAETPASGATGFHPHAPASVAALSTGAAPFSGWIDDIRLFDRGLSQQDVIDILFEDDVVTSLRENPPRLMSDGRLALPDGRWTHGRLLDTAGRNVRDITSTDLAGGFDLSGIPQGSYLIHLQGQERRAAWPIVVR